LNIDYQPQTLNEFINAQQTAFPYAKGDLTRLLNHIGIAAKIVNRKVNVEGLAEILGKAGGLATYGKYQRIPEIKPTSIHQRVPFFSGSKKMVKELEKQIKQLA
jgi:fructose-1,6-bisphosphatase